MEKLQEMVREFSRKFQHDVSETPQFPEGINSLNSLRLKLEEESEELRAAIRNGFFAYIPESDALVGIADAIGDSIYVLLGLACLFGIEMSPVMEEIHKSNMSKSLKEGGIVKTDAFSPPALRKVLEAQGMGRE